MKLKDLIEKLNEFDKEREVKIFILKEDGNHFAVKDIDEVFENPMSVCGGKPEITVFIDTKKISNTTSSANKNLTVNDIGKLLKTDPNAVFERLGINPDYM